MLGVYSINCDTRLLNDICNYHCALNTGSFFYKHNRKQIVSGYLLCWEKDDKSVQRNVLTVTLKTAQNCVYEVFVYINEYILKVNKKSNHVVRILTCHWIRSFNIIDDCIDTKWWLIIERLKNMYKWITTVNVYIQYCIELNSLERG